ncbi:MAG: hypothetical protein IJE04_02400 [Bacilli bacterium]|nr:hypothetical protein [Bacilli bacterium]
MYDDFLLNNDLTSKVDSSADLDSLFNNLTTNIDNFNKYLEDVNKKKKENVIEEQELFEEKLRIDKAKLEFENYVKEKNAEYETKMNQVESYLETQKQNLLKAETEFKNNMDNSFNELDLIKRELDIQKERIKEEKEQFETYKNLELNRIKHSQEMLESEKTQFEKYKEVNNRKIELESKNLEQKCDKFRELVSQFNSKFNPMLKEEE